MSVKRPCRVAAFFLDPQRWEWPEGEYRRQWFRLMARWGPRRLSLHRLFVVPPHCPVPVRKTACGLLLALSVTLSVAERAPAAVGLKTTLMVHVDLAAKLVVQLWAETAKSFVSLPVNVKLLMVRAVDRLFLRVTRRAALVVPTFCAG
jgi:hypothetical protein